jgi:demethylmenaquinone methyltransferase/2-methoxy-6-polyprenyl-1,4-benzoquinol methylase
VVRHGGSIGMVEFGVPTGIWKPLWTAYTRALLPRVGTVISPGWKDVGHFLEPSIVDFHRKFPGTALVDMWEASGITDVRMGRMSVGGGLIISGRRK